MGRLMQWSHEGCPDCGTRDNFIYRNCDDTFRQWCFILCETCGYMEATDSDLADKIMADLGWRRKSESEWQDLLEQED